MAVSTKECMMLLTTVLIITCITTAYSQEQGYTHRELYVKSTPTQQCPQHHQCHTLLSYLQNGTTSFTSNTTLHFLPGNHSAAMPQPMKLVISNISNLSLRGPEVGPDEPPVAQIWCNYTIQFRFTNASNISLERLAIHQCGTRAILSAVSFVYVDSLAVENVHIMNSLGFGLMVWDSFGNISVTNSYFYYNSCPNNLNGSCGGNAIFYYSTSILPTGPTDVQVISSTFAYGNNKYVGKSPYWWYHGTMGDKTHMSAGLSIIVSSKATLSGIVVTVSDCTFHNNQAAYGANMMVSVEHSNQSISLTILNSSFINGTAQYYGGGLYLYSVSNFYMHNSAVIGNSAYNGGGFSLGHTKGGAGSIIKVSDTIFVRNKAYSNGGGVYISGVHTKIFTSYAIFSLGIFIQNEARDGGSGMYATQYYFWITESTFYRNNGSAAIELHNGYNCDIYDTKFIDNCGGSVAVHSSRIALYGHVEFSGNTANHGAAILLDCPERGEPSYVSFDSSTTVNITNNTALYYGGGIAVDPGCDYEYEICECFLSTAWMDPIGYLPVVYYFSNNKAGLAGHSIYGPIVSGCEEEKLQTLFSIEGGFLSDQVVLAHIYSICFCDVVLHTELTCSTIDKHVYVLPGDEFSVTALVTGTLDPSNGYVRAHLTTSGQLGSSKLQEIQELGRSCELQLTYSVMTTAKTTQIDLQAVNVPNAPHSLINITILQCPLGFEFNNSKRKCDCSEYLRSKVSEVTCDITRRAIDAPGNMWIGNLSNNRLGAHQHCPFDYCNPEPHSIKFSNQHQQCTSNRSGVLCGACNSGFSLALGTARCLDNCTHYYLFLIIPFALAGVAVVFVLLKCNLTVSMGTTNALIFYANIIHTNRTIFFPQNNVNIITRFLAVFIAWLNLDLGIETCLYRGMAAYANAWLQFVFPVYIWLLVLIMIYSSRYSVTASKLIGRNAVSVLATLFLLSYAKLLRTIIAVLSSINIEDEDKKQHLLWLMDGNVSYFSAPHAVLCVVALIAILLYIVPLTLLTLLAPYLQARTNHRMMRWVTRIKPLLDAYQGPYNDKYRYWTGVMFIQRIVLFTVFTANIAGNPNINLFAICVLITVALIYQIYRGRLYKNSLNWFLEEFYSLNLAIYTFAVLSLNGSQRSMKYLSWVMVGSVFTVFCLTVIWHFNYQTSVISRTVKKIKDHLGNQRRRQAKGLLESTDPPPPLRQPQPTVSVIDLRELKEPLLTKN